MASFSFNEIDFGDYNVTVLNSGGSRLERIFKYGQLQERVYGWRSQLEARRLPLKVLISATAAQDIHDLITECHGALNEKDDCKLALDEISGRYWMARFRSMTGELINPKYWRGEIEFTLSDPRALADAETSSGPTAVDADPDTIIETVGGTAFVEPRYILTAGEVLNGATIVVENMTTGEELTWEGDLADTKELEIDVAHWIVYNDSVADMADVVGSFPTMQPGANSIKVTGFGTLGTLDIIYRDAYI